MKKPTEWKCRRGYHEFNETEVKGGTVGLLYADRECVHCGLRLMRNSRLEWTMPFTLKFSWEQEDRDTGTVIYRGPER